MIESLGAFLVEGPVQSAFTSWLAQLDPAFPNRHAVAHGRFEPALFNRINLIKSILLIDSIFAVTKPAGPDISGGVEAR
jgi:hypothetical protein